MVRTALNLGAEVFAIFEGYRGMLEGGPYIKQMGWSDVEVILQEGGTIIGSARLDGLPAREGQRKAALNLITNGIQGLVVIGGDGSLTGANHFRREWSELLKELACRGGR